MMSRCAFSGIVSWVVDAVRAASLWIMGLRKGGGGAGVLRGGSERDRVFPTKIIRKARLSAFGVYAVCYFQSDLG